MMATFAVVVYIIIIKSLSAVKFKFLSICLLVMWLVCVVFSSTLLFPGVLQLNTLQETGCVPHSVVILIIAFCYARANIVIEHAASLRPLLKFSTFLLLGNLLSAIGQSIPVIAAYVGSPTTEVNLAINQANGIIILFSHHSHTHSCFGVLQARISEVQQ